MKRRSWLRVLLFVAGAVVVAIVIGIPVVAVATMWEMGRIPLFADGVATVHVADAAQFPACTGDPDWLLIAPDTAAGSEHRYATAGSVSTNYKYFFAKYADRGGDQRCVRVDLDGKTARVQALCGAKLKETARKVDAAKSSVHLHEDRVCFDLAVEAADGTPAQEHWRGSVKRDKPGQVSH